MKNLFAIPLLHEKLKLDPNYYYDQITTLRFKRPNTPEQYTSFFDEDPMLGMEWAELKEDIIAYTRGYISEVMPRQKRVPKIGVAAWWNLYDEHNHHCWHTHENSFLAGTYYVHTSEHTSGIEFVSPLSALIRNSYPYFGMDTRFEQSTVIKPESGDLLIWPAWLSHMIPAQKQVKDKFRCSISFNIQLGNSRGV